MDIPVAVKNPTQPDLALWSGAAERLQRAGIQDVMAIHRGFTVHGQKKYRNAPLWQIPIDFRNAHPDIPLLNDPSHITGKRAMVSDVAQMSVDLGFDGLMVEVHPDPDVAWTDAAQQVTPARFLTLVEELDFRSDTGGATHERLATLRSEIDVIDESLVELLVRRMGVSEQIGLYKKDNGLTILQNARWKQILRQNAQLAEGQGLDPQFIEDVYKAIHQASIAAQRKVIRDRSNRTAPTLRWRLLGGRMTGLEPATSSSRTTRATNCATSRFPFLTGGKDKTGMRIPALDLYRQPRP